MFAAKEILPREYTRIINKFERNPNVGIKYLSTESNRYEITNTIRKGLIMLTKMVTDWHINVLEWKKIIQIILDTLPNEDIHRTSVVSKKVT